jgi:hypothetical protein
MDDARLPADRVEERALGLDTDHVTERQIGRRVGRSRPADPGGSDDDASDDDASDDDASDDDAAVERALLDAGAHVVPRTDRPGEDLEIEGPNPA